MNSKTLLDQFHSCRLGFGGAALSGEGAGYGFGSISEEEARDLVLEAFDLGVRLYDTAPIYGFGLSEQRLGRAFKQRREQVFFVSKAGVTWHENKRVDMTNEPKVVARMLDESLKSLDSDYIDLYMIHWPDSKVDIRRSVEVLAQAQLQGKIKHIGLCNTNISEITRAQEVAMIEAVQNQFNLMENDDAQEFLPWLREQGISYMSWGTLDKGILTGTVTRERKFDPSDCRSWAPWWKAIDFEARYQKVENLRKIADLNHLTPIELAIGHNLATPGLSMVLCGAKNSQQLQGCLKALRPLSDDVMKQLSEF